MKTVWLLHTPAWPACTGTPDLTAWLCTVEHLMWLALLKGERKPVGLLVCGLGRLWLVTVPSICWLQEFSMAAASLADSLGVALADATGILIQGCLFRANNLEGADFKC